MFVVQLDQFEGTATAILLQTSSLDKHILYRTGRDRQRENDVSDSVEKVWTFLCR